MPGGRPSSYNQDTVDMICERLSCGESLRSICRDEDSPGLSTVFKWLATVPEFREQYAHAREAQAEALFDEIIEIADTPQIGQKTVSKATGVEITEADMIEHRRLQVDARKWIASKLAPKKYGDKITQEVTGANGGPILTRDVSELSDEALAAIINGQPS